MEETNQNNLQRIDPDTELTVQDVKELSERAETIVENIANVARDVTGTVRDLAMITANVKIQCAQLEHDFDCLLLKAQKDLKVYEMSLPTLNEQLTRCQNRLDKVIDRAMDMALDDLSEQSLARQECVMSLVEITNSSLNSLIAKLMPSL